MFKIERMRLKMMKKTIWFIFAALILFSFSVFLHFWKFPEIPNGFYYDEASVGYNAYCVAMTGADEYGVKHPVFFKCFGNYHDPVMVYTLAPLVRVFGLEKWVERLPSGIFLILASTAFFFLAKKYVRNRWICLVGAFVFSILPWVFPISRTGIGGYAAMLLGMIAGSYFLLDAIGRKSFASAVLSGAFCAFAMYAHNIGRPTTAIMLVCFVLAFNVRLIKRWKVFALFAAAYVAFLAPMVISVINNPGCMTARFSGMSVWSDGAPAFDVMKRILERYMEYFSPAFLFIRGDYELRHNAGGYGELYVFMAPFVIAGFYFIIRNFRRNPYCRFMLLTILSYPAAAVLTVDRMHSTRCMNGAPFWCILAVTGFYFIWTCKPRFRVAVIAVLCFSILEVSLYFVNYFGKYAADSRGAFYASFSESVEYCFKNLSGDETLYVSDSVFFQPVDRSFKPYWYVYFLFYGKVAPATYQKTGIPEYMRAYDGKICKPGIFIRMNSRISVDAAGNPVAVLNTESIPEGSKLLHKIPLCEGSDRYFEIYRVL
jgi:hypothetical protein